jgi:hypothetical protein
LTVDALISKKVSYQRMITQSIPTSMRYSFAFIIICLTPIFQVSGQSDSSAISLEKDTQQLVVLDASYFPFPFYLGIATISYERHLWTSKRGGVAICPRAGLSVMGTGTALLEVLRDVPGASIVGGVGLNGGVSFLFGRSHHRFEIFTGGILNFMYFETGVGVEFFNSQGPPFWPQIDLGYRYTSPRSPLSLRVKLGTSGVGAGVGWAF